MQRTRPIAAPQVSINTSPIAAVREATNDWWYSSVAAKMAHNIQTLRNKVCPERSRRIAFICGFVSRRSARQRRMARMAYSVTCPSFRKTKWTCANASGEKSGLSQSKNGMRKREVCSADIRSVEPIKMKPSQIKTGSQYFRKLRACIRPGANVGSTYLRHKVETKTRF